MKTTLELPEELLRTIKVKAARENRKLKDVVAELLQMGLSGKAAGGSEEVEALTAEIRRLRREIGRETALSRIARDAGPGDGSRVLTRAELAEAWGIAD